MTIQKYIRCYFGWVLTRLLLLAAAVVLFLAAAHAANDDEEVVLTFSHPAVGQYYVTGVYSNNSVYLPAMEIFNLLYVHYEKGSSGQSLKGTWLNEKNNWEINANSLTATMGKEKIAMTAQDFRFGELDLYLSPALLERMFGLKFSVNMINLSLSLQFDKTLPVEEKREHEEMRKQLERKRADEKDFPLLYGRNRKIAGAGMLDYNLMMIKDNVGTSGTYTLTGGMEILGGDVQGTVYGNVANTVSPLKYTNLNWRYAFGENPFLTSFKAGQLTTTGLESQRIVGGSISNDPIEPRKVYNNYSIDGNTTPDSEVELYVNNQLTDYARADELGYYRFNFSLSYGTVRISLRIYTPSGEIITEERQMQIPFTFLPKGVISYNMQAGALDDGYTDVTFDRYAAHGDVAWGLTNTITAKVGTDYLSFSTKPFYYGSLSARIFDQYLFNLDAAPDAYYRATGSVNYPSNRSINLIYTKFVNDSLYNPRHAIEYYNGGIYTPFKFIGLQSGLRLGGEHYLLKNSNSQTNYNVDLSTRLGRFNVRANYRDQLIGNSNNYTFGNGTSTASVTYTFSRTPGIPVFVRGMFMRGQTQYNVRSKEFTGAGVQVSKTVSKNGRLNVTVDRDLLMANTRVQAGFTLDLDFTRSTTQYTTNDAGYALQQTLNGSIGLDARSAKLDATNREQVGRAAVSILMFIDGNDNRTYDEGEEKVPGKAIRLSLSATMQLGKDSLLRITQLQSYWRYNAEVVVSALPNPTLAPLMTEFSFVADPNRYKLIEIPLYRTGVIEGTVNLSKESKESGIGGVRLVIKSLSRDYSETTRTFSDGGFYLGNLLPGKYIIEVDPTQLSFLDATSKPGKLEFEVKALAAGDYVDGLNILLISNK